ncbi:hypothetical protein [Neobacillus rhizophilus]|nr:hypothetical protein [Neobacillus rhizophilus]
MNLLKLEMMTATERMAEALTMRGLFVETKGDFIVLTEENTSADIMKTKRLLNDLGIPTFWQGNQFQILVSRFPIAAMKKIINVPGKEFPVHMEGYHFKWRAFAQRRFGIKVNALDLDANMAMFVKTLNLAGITALAGCSGHHRYPPNVQLSGVYQGAWFKVIQEKYFSGLNLHYTWEVHFDNGSGSCIRAVETGRWDMSLIYQDTVQMAEVLQKYAAEIRELKKSSFKRSKEMKETAGKLLKEEHVEALVEWMTEQAEKQFSLI